MSRPPRTCSRSLIDAHFAGSVSPAREKAMRAHLPDCEACRGYYDRHLGLAQLDPRAISAEERIARGLGLRARPQAATSWWVALAFAAAVALVAFVPLSGRHASEYTTRGTLGAASPQFFAYRIDPAQRLEVRGSVIRATDDLAFAYTNAPGFRALLVYGVDEHRHVYWYYPAWSNPAEDPHAIPISAGPQVRELPEGIRHDLDGRELTIHAVFLQDDATVRRVERLVSEARVPGDPLPIAGAHEERLTLTVER